MNNNDLIDEVLDTLLTDFYTDGRAKAMAKQAILSHINKEKIEELQAIYDRIDTGNVYLGLGKISDRINELATERDHLKETEVRDE